MERLVNVTPIEEQLGNHVRSATGRSMAVIGYSNALAMLMAAPAVEAVVPVYCRTCRFWGPRLEDEGTGLCWVNGPGWLLVRRSDDYCSSGRRRQDGDPAPASPCG